MNRFVIALSLPKKSLFLVAFGMFAASAHAQVSLLSQTFDGYAAGGTVPVGAGQTFLSNTGTFPVSNTSAAALFPAASSASSVAGGDAGTNYAVFGGGSAYVARTNTITGTSGALFSVVYDTNLPTTGSGAVALTLISAAATDTNGQNPNTFTGFSLTSAGAVVALGTGVTLTGGTSATVPIGTQFALSLLVNDTTAATTYLNNGALITLPAFSADLYSNSVAGGTNYIGRLTSATGTSATVNAPQQLGFRTFNGNTFSDRINEIDVTTGLNVATLVPEPSTYACLLVALGSLAVYTRRRVCREA